MAVKHKSIECREKDEVYLTIIIGVLKRIEQQKSSQQCLLSKEARLEAKQCKKIVSDLGMVAIPTTPEDYVRFMTQIAMIQEFLLKYFVGDELIICTLQAFYTEISDPQKHPTPTMSIVLKLIDPQNIPKAVKWILQSSYPESGLEQALHTLCTWLSKWTWTPNLGLLVLEFMKGLAAEQHYEILVDITLTHIERLFKMLILPDPRTNVGPVVFHMLTSMQHNPKAFHKIIPHIGMIMRYLCNEKMIDSSRYYLESLFNLSMALMEHFPGYACYEQLKQTLKPYEGLTGDYKQLLMNSKAWLNKSQTTTLSQYAPGKVGLNNLGNTCYMNSVLQALFMTKPFRNDILAKSKDAVPLFFKLQSLFALLQFSERSSLSPSEILTAARPPGFQMGQQHDSSEFLGHLLDVLHEQERLIGNSNEHDDATTSGSNITTVVKKSFGGKTLTMSQCNNCGARSERMDTFRDLQLSFPSDADNQSVQTLMDYYLQKEKLCDDNQYHCDECCGLTDGERITRIIEPPPRLVLTLKHFSYDPKTQARTKILKRVQLDDNVYVDSNEYKLYAAVVHCGSSVDSGHYYTYAKDCEDWYKFNDCFVMKSKAEELCGLRSPEAPYILFYSRVDCSDPEPMGKCDLSSRLQSVLSRDYADLDAEKKKPKLSISAPPRPNNKDDYDPPPPGCGGGGFMDSTQNRFVC
ncbi:PREDICTED: ubiquitin carboxyl-terminal hydrolase 38 [Nicrophorus vespilloides]|uniref:Ubiquitin carboxyl-terminal hydrolase 38 n=1 Tax=Nicrophorus vespilloides TaxID=110193 RepID=A0ABM1MK11_NICVS|nr:PREDICTED: ubiquitin carboxyl-terminal hydrolase 38 [Nicrophorus vespilloides]